MSAAPRRPASRRPAPRRPRPADAARVALGTALLARPGLAVRCTRSPDGAWPRRIARILGIRYVMQSTAGLATHRPWLRAADTGVDVVHAVSMLGFARAFPRHRRMAWASAAAALVFAALDATERGR